MPEDIVSTNPSNSALIELAERYRLRRIPNGSMTRGWQILRDGRPISFMFDERADAEAAMHEFRSHGGEKQ